MSLIKQMVGLSQVAVGQSAGLYEPLLLSEERVLLEYKGIRDRLIITDRRLLLIDPQGITGKKKSFLTLPLAKLSAFEVETAGTFDMDAEFTCWLSGMGSLKLSFVKGTDVKAISRVLSEQLL